jgi:O-succinylbenzoic acid--CoA ligase
MMSRPTPRRLSVRPGPAGVADVAVAMRDLLDGQAQPLAIAPAPSGHHAASLSSALREDAPIDRDDAALIVATSGSTGEPQGVLLSAPALVAAADRGTAALGGPGLWLVAVPVTGIGGIIAVLRSVRGEHEPRALSSVGGAAPFTAETFAREALATVRRADELGVPAYVSLVPTQLRRLVAHGAAALDALAGFHAVLVGGSALRAQDRAAAQAGGVRLVETYGATETCGGVLYNGTPLAGVGVAFRDPSSGAISDAGPGRVIISGPTLALGYRLRPDLTAAAFQPDGFHSPDIGRLVPGGIEVAARLDQIVKVGGVKVSLQAVSHALCGHLRVIDALTVAEIEPEWGMVPVSYVVTDTHDVDSEPLRGELLELVADRLGRASMPRRIELVDDLPLGHTGKPARPGAP